MENTLKFEAGVIWAENCSRSYDQYVAFRRNFRTDEDGACRVRLFAETYYNLYIDGEFIHRGPVRRHEQSAEYDEIECYLKKGEHTLAVLVHWLGRECAAHRLTAPAFWCNTEGVAEIATDAGWKARFCGEFHSDGEMLSHFDFRENLDLQAFDMGWLYPEYDDSRWEAARLICAADSEQDPHKNYSPRKMKLFSYAWERAVITKSGRFKESRPEEKFFFDRFMARERDTDTADGSFAVAAFNTVISGTVFVRYSNAAPGTELIIGYDDNINEHGMPNPGRYMVYGDRFLLPQGDGEFEVLMPRGFRYLLIDVSGECRIEKVLARKELYPYLPKSMEFSDPYWKTLYRQSVLTQRICTIDGYTDCVNRERVLWLGDAWIDAMSAYYAEPDRGLLLTTLYEHAMGQVESGAVGGYNSSNFQPDWIHIASYNLMYLNMLCDYVLFTGSEEDIIPLKNTARGIIRFINGNRNENGIFDTRYKDCSNYWDWGYKDAPGQSLKTNAFFIYTIERMAEFEIFRELTAELLPELQPLREKCRELFWDEKRRIFHDGCLLGEKPDPLSTQCANALAVLSGICGDELCDELLERICDPAELDAVPVGENQAEEQHTPDREKILPSGTMYSALIVSMALFEKKRYDLGLRYMREVWGPFESLPTLPELRFNGPNNTMCHGWSGGPAYLIPRYLWGLYPSSPAWKSAVLTVPDVKPWQLSCAGGKIETPQGDITVQWFNMGGSLKLTAALPKSVELQLSYCGGTMIFKDTVNCVIIDKRTEH